VAVTADDTSVGATPDATSTTLSISVTQGNLAPTAVTLANPVTTVTTLQSAQLKVADIQVTDDGQGTNTLAITGADAAKFEIVGQALFLKAGQTLTAGGTLAVAVTADDTSVGATPDATSATLSISVTQGNLAPTAVTLANMIGSISNLQTAQLKVADIQVTDDGQGTNTLAVTGADAAKFEIVGQALFLRAGQTLTAGATLAVAVTADDTSVGATPDATSTTLSISVTQGNSPPVAMPDGGAGFSTDEDTSFTTASVLANDTDPDGDPLTVTALSLVGTKGSVTASGNGTYSYNPNGQFAALNLGETATDSFGYTVSDGHGGTASATVTITIQGKGGAPVAVNDSATTTFQTAATINVTANDIGGAAVTSIQIAGQPQNGTATVSGLSIVYTPASGFSGQDSFSYVALAGSIMSASATVTVTVQWQSGFTAGSLRNATQDERLLSTASALDDVCVSLNGLPVAGRSADQKGLFSMCQGLATSAAAGSIDTALAAITNEEAFAASDSSLDIGRAISDNLYARLDAVNGGDRVRGVNLAGLQFASATAWTAPLQSMTAKALGAGLNHLVGATGDAETRWGFFMSGQLQFGKHKSGSAAGAREFNTLGLTAGVDYALTDKLIAGVAFSYSKLDSDFRSGSTGLNVSGLTYSLYAALDLGLARLDGHVSYSDRNYDSQRSIIFTAAGTNVDALAEANFGGTDYIAGLRAYTPIFADRWGLDLIGGLTYFRTTIDGYGETGAGGLNLNVRKQQHSFLIGDVGFRASRSFETRSGSFSPRLDLKYHRASGRDDRRVTAGFAVDPLERTAIELLSTSDSDSDYFSALIGFSARITRASVGVSYSSIMGLEDVTTQQISVSLSLPF
jgi:uncharacterized protein YhjY with autotransporter beta-barrel domain